MGWTIGEEVLFSRDKKQREETCKATKEGCVLGIQRKQLGALKQTLAKMNKGSEFA